MTVLNKLTIMVSTGFTGVPLLLGHSLFNVMKLIKEALDESEDPNERFLDFNNKHDFYSNLFYHRCWECTIRPIIAKYIEEHYPNAWFKVYYTQYYE